MWGVSFCIVFCDHHRNKQTKKLGLAFSNHVHTAKMHNPVNINLPASLGFLAYLIKDLAKTVGQQIYIYGFCFMFVIKKMLIENCKTTKKTGNLLTFSAFTLKLEAAIMFYLKFTTSIFDTVSPAVLYSISISTVVVLTVNTGFKPQL